MATIKNLWVRTKKDGKKQYVLPIGQADPMMKKGNDVIQIFQVIGEETHNRYLTVEEFKKFYQEITEGYDE